LNIKFIADAVVNDYRVGTKDEESYAEGQSVEMPDASAQHWINRGKAVAVEKAKPGRKKVTKKVAAQSEAE